MLTGPARVASAAFRGLILVWRYGVSPVIGPRCRFHPSCSEYGLQALVAHGPWRGGALTVRRVCRCHPWSAGGYDPVPAPNAENAKPAAQAGSQITRER
jgi:putative membrane protein insertion efficiency factor